MLTSVLLACSPSDAPAWELEVDGEPLLYRLVQQLAAYGEVVVVGRHPRAAGPVDGLASARLVEVHEPAAAARWLAHATFDELLVLSADVVTGDLAIERLADDAVSGTTVLVGPFDEPATGLARVARGLLTSATSPYHQAAAADRSLRGAIRIAPRDLPQLTAAAAEVAELVSGELDADLAAELRRKLEAGDLGVLGDDRGRPLDDASMSDDIVAPLVVAMLRRGVALRELRLPEGLPWHRPRTADEAAAAVEAVRATDEERVRLDASVKEEDGFFTTFFVSTYSRYWARWCARRGLRPDQVTVASMGLGILAACAFAIGQRWGFVAGALLLQLAFTLDCVDGQLARYTRHFSGSGAWLDSIFDRGKEYVVYAGLAAGGVRAGDDPALWALAGVALTIQVFRHMLDFGYAARQNEDLRPPAPYPFDAVAGPGMSHWEPASSRVAQDREVAGVRRLARTAVATLRAAEGIGPLKWAKRIVVLPIGERFAVISIVTAFVHPGATFWVLIVWGGLATGYTFGGRLVRSLA